MTLSYIYTIYINNCNISYMIMYIMYTLPYIISYNI